MTKSSRNRRRWAIPLASLVPTLAIAYAFSLGPSPRKLVASYCAHDGERAQRAALLEGADAKLVRAVVESLPQRNLQHRDELITWVGQSHVIAAAPVLERIVNDDSEPELIRRLAFESWLDLEPRRGLSAAERLQHRTDGLGRAARVALQNQERSAAPRAGPAAL